MKLFTSKEQDVLKEPPGFPFLVQEYVNHNAVVIKVHVIGDTVSSNMRESWRNIAKAGMFFFFVVVISNC